MSDDDNGGGYGKPPMANQWPKGTSGNPKGRRRKPNPTLANLIEKTWMEPITANEGGVVRQYSGFELIVRQLLAKIAADGSAKAHKVFRKYEAFAKSKPRIMISQIDTETAAAEFAENFREGRECKRPKRKKIPKEKRKVLTLNNRIARMRAGLEPPDILEGMTVIEAAEMYDLILEQTSQANPTRAAKRRKSGKLAASEIFDNAINEPVTLPDGKTVPRILAMVLNLRTKALKGNIASADLLVELHKYSTKHGDFFPEVKYIS